MLDNENPSLLNLDQSIKARTGEKNQQLKKVMLGALAALALVLLLIAFQFLPDRQPPQPNSSSAPATSLDKTAYSQAALDKARDLFKQALTDFEANSQPILNNIDIQQWSDQRVDEILALKQQALISFASGAYVIAANQLAQAKSEADSLSADWESAFLSSLGQAQSYFQNNDMNNARLALKQAVQIKPNAPDIIALEQRIDGFQRVSKAIKSYRVAQAENNLSKQIDALHKIIKLDPARTQYASQLQQLIQQRDNASVAQKLNRALNALNAEDVASASREHAELLSLAPNNDAVKQLGNRLQILKNTDNRAQALRELKTLADVDDWAAVVQRGNTQLRASADSATDAEIKLLVETGENIVSIQHQLDRYLANPQRLQDGNIQRNAQALMAKAVPVITQSKQLSQRVKKLSDMVSVLTVKQPVTVISDNKTEIKVLGVGVVGTTSLKIIELLPGTYTFEGQCKGYKNKQVVIKVTANSKDNIVSLVCDERI